MQCALAVVVVVAGIIWQCKLHVKAQSSVSSQAKKKPGRQSGQPHHAYAVLALADAHKKPIKQTALKLT